MFHSTDGVCPSVLDCRQGLEDGCATRPFGNEAYGFNLAIIPAPARIRARAHRHLGRAVMYIATSRQCGGEPMKKASQVSRVCPHRECALTGNEHALGCHTRCGNLRGSSTDLLLLDSTLRIVARSMIPGEYRIGCHSQHRSITDARPLVDLNDRLWVSYTSYGARDDESCRLPTGALPKSGSAIAPLTITFENTTLTATVQSEHKKVARAQKNAVFVFHRTQGLIEIVHIAKRANRTRRIPLPGGVRFSAQSHHFGVQFDHALQQERPLHISAGLAWGGANGALHSSFHPIFVEELGFYLGGAHKYYSHAAEEGTPQGVRLKHGLYYYFILLAISPDLSTILHNSKEMCFSALHAIAESGPTESTNATGPHCEIVQFPMSAFLHQHQLRGASPSLEAMVTITYGVNDCAAAAVTLTLSTIRHLLNL
mmetsp:Transcript_45786/g.148871  ORF Transcript_45786/g.148871 Transcript_45786/m.148871 type:complete len:427 (+) Transcript_45786:187-1467(+)